MARGEPGAAGARSADPLSDLIPDPKPAEIHCMCPTFPFRSPSGPPSLFAFLCVLLKAKDHGRIRVSAELPMLQFVADDLSNFPLITGLRDGRPNMCRSRGSPAATVENCANPSRPTALLLRPMPAGNTSQGLLQALC